MRTLLRWYLGQRQFPKELSRSEIQHFFTFTDDDCRELRIRFPKRVRLGAALQLGFFAHGGDDIADYALRVARTFEGFGQAIAVRGSRRRDVARALLAPLDESQAGERVFYKPTGVAPVMLFSGRLCGTAHRLPVRVHDRVIAVCRREAQIRMSHSSDPLRRHGVDRHGMRIENGSCGRPVRDAFLKRL
jgi:hypothetical protein